MELAEIKKALASRADEVCRHLLPGGKLERNEWVCGDLSGGEGSSLKVVLNGEKAGIFKDFAGDIGGSNLLELWVQVKGLPFLTALTEAKEWLGQHGVKQSEDLRGLRRKTFSKPNKAGITRIIGKAEMYLTAERSIPSEIVTLFKVGQTDDGSAIVFPYLSEQEGHEAVMIKFVKLERDEKGKKVSWTSKDTAKILYGMHTVRPDDRSIIITEGEIDAMSYRAVGLTALSVPFGAKWEGKDGRDPNEEWIENCWDFLSQFERIYLSMDMDEEGRKAQASIIKRLGREICFVITLPTKDANELLIAGRGEELKAAFEAAKTLDPETLKNASEFKQDVLDRLYAGDLAAKRGIPLPFGSYPFHLRWNEWTAVTGQNGSGKTQLIGHLLVYLNKLNYKSCVASLEVPVGQTLAFYVSQTTGVKLPDRKVAERALDWLATGFWFYDYVGEAKWPEVLAAFRYAYRRYGVRFFVIDSWMKMGISGDDFEAQSACLNAISDFVRDCPVHCFVVAHPRKLKNEVEVVGKMDIKGSGELTDQAHNVVIVWRNKAKEKDIEKSVKLKDDDAKVVAKRRLKPDAQMIVVKQKNDDGDEPTIDLWFDKPSKQFHGWYVDKGTSVLDAEEAAPVEPVAEVAAGINEDEPF